MLFLNLVCLTVARACVILESVFIVIGVTVVLDDCSDDVSMFLVQQIQDALLSRGDQKQETKIISNILKNRKK
jgi:hypothetical protein